MPPTLLITRPDPDGARFADAARTALGFDPRVVLSPLLRIERRRVPDPGDAATLLLTSQHALFAAPRDMPTYVVGPRLASLARDAGLSVRMTAPDATTLLQMLRDDPPQPPLLHLRGEHVAVSISNALSKAGLPTREAVVYTQHAQPLTPEARACLSGENPVVIPLFSPRSGCILFENAPFTAPLVILALSDAVAATVPDAYAGNVLVAPRPDAKALLEELPAAWNVARRVEGNMSPQ
ncbi:uroporphyrinogen-III synthase [Roseovarius sp. E0-M6]|uniref:uroporphyrinogen-III synthase n=1 Tax=Roseovarius sp. E0-M6 TaxID=3127118 RepID=UPI0030102ECF